MMSREDLEATVAGVDLPGTMRDLQRDLETMAPRIIAARRAAYRLEQEDTAARLGEATAHLSRCAGSLEAAREQFRPEEAMR